MFAVSVFEDIFVVVINLTGVGMAGSVFTIPSLSVGFIVCVCVCLSFVSLTRDLITH